MPKQSKIKKIPKFKNEDDERNFWATHSLTDYFDMSKAIINLQFPKLKFTTFKPSTKTITLRIPEEMYHNLKNLANKLDVPYQSYMKIMLAEKIHELKMADQGSEVYSATMTKPKKTKSQLPPR